MVGPQWSDDPNTPELQRNLDRVAQDVVLDACGDGPMTAGLIKSWHHGMHHEIPVPCDTYVGNFRGDSNHSELLDAENSIHGIRGVRSYRVYGEVESLLQRVREDIESIGDPVDSIAGDMEIIRIASYAHGEWIRIHPFVNGNGRTARLLVLWILARFKIPPLLPIRPRPDPPYDTTSDASMMGDHGPFESYLRDLYLAEARRTATSSSNAADPTADEPDPVA